MYLNCNDMLAENDESHTLYTLSYTIYIHKTGCMYKFLQNIRNTYINAIHNESVIPQVGDSFTTITTINIYNNICMYIYVIICVNSCYLTI